MDPEVKKYFLKIIYSFSLGFVWLFSVSTGGLYYRLGFVYAGVRWYNVAFYVFFAGSFLLLLWYYYSVWKNPVKDPSAN